MDRNLQRHKIVNERLQQILEQAQGIKPFDYDNVFNENNEFKKQHGLLQVIIKALIMEEKDVNLWWDVVQDESLISSRID